MDRPPLRDPPGGVAGREAEDSAWDTSYEANPPLGQPCKPSKIDPFEILQEMTGYSGAAHYGPERAGDIKHSLADISLAGKLMGYKPVAGFEEGLARTVAWYRTQAAKSVVSR